MSDVVIGDYTAAATIDGGTHYMLIQPGDASTAYKKINRNVYLGVTGQPADISTAQNITNKTLNNTNIITVRDDRFTVQDNADTTKQAVFQASGITTATTRTYTLPDRSSTLATLGGNQTFTGANSFTGSSWSGGTIDNATVTIDAVSGHTTPNSGTVYGMSVTSGTIGAAGLASNSVITAKIADSAVTPAKLVAGTGSTWAGQSWALVFTNVSGGTLNYATYIQIGKTVFFRFKYTLASAGVSGDIAFTLPVTASSDYTNGNTTINGNAILLDNGTQGYTATFIVNSTTSLFIRPDNTSATYGTYGTAASSTVPFTWASGDVIQGEGSYGAA